MKIINSNLKSALFTLSFVVVDMLFSSSAMAQRQEAPAKSFGQSRPVAGRYIVVFKDSVNDVRTEALALAQSHGGQIKHLYGHAIKGFSAMCIFSEQYIQFFKNIRGVRNQKCVVDVRYKS